MEAGVLQILYWLCSESRRGECAPPPRRPARREAEGGSRGGYSGQHQGAKVVKIAEDVRKYAAEQDNAEEEALKKKMIEKSKEFVERRAQIFAKA
jgi:hypothetical protein